MGTPKLAIDALNSGVMSLPNFQTRPPHPLLLQLVGVDKISLNQEMSPKQYSPRRMFR